MSNVGSLVSTYGLEDSGSDTTMIDPSLVKMLNIKGSSKISRTTVRVGFKIASVDSQNNHVVNAKFYLGSERSHDPSKAY